MKLLQQKVWLRITERSSRRMRRRKRTTPVTLPLPAKLSTLTSGWFFMLGLISHRTCAEVIRCSLSSRSAG